MAGRLFGSKALEPVTNSREVQGHRVRSHSRVLLTFEVSHDECQISGLSWNAFQRANPRGDHGGNACGRLEAMGQRETHVAARGRDSGRKVHKPEAVVIVASVK